MNFQKFGNQIFPLFECSGFGSPLYKYVLNNEVKFQYSTYDLNNKVVRYSSHDLNNRPFNNCDRFGPFKYML